MRRICYIILKGNTVECTYIYRTLKDQRMHFDNVCYQKPRPEFPDKMKEAMKHGTDNELNAVATLVSKILPALWPNVSFHEEGCTSFNENGKIFMVVSPDGSCWEDGETRFAIEIKCPVPGKKYTTDVHYDIPDYYLCQVLSEMKALTCDKLLYVCYTPPPGSTTCLMVEFDHDAWREIYSVTKDIYLADPLTRPKGKGAHVSSTKQMLSNFKSTHVTFVGEFNSLTAIKHTQEFDQSTMHAVPPEQAELYTQPLPVDEAQELMIKVCATKLGMHMNL